MNFRLFQISALCALLFFLAANVCGQAVKATILGTITDGTGAVLPTPR
jgi:hypothetical protein